MVQFDKIATARKDIIAKRTDTTAAQPLHPFLLTIPLKDVFFMYL